MLGTRSKQSDSQLHPAATQDNNRLTRDVGLAQRVVASLTFLPGTRRISGAAGTFSAFKAGYPVTVYGTNKNNGDHEIITVAGDGSFITVDWPPTSEGPITAEVRLS